MSSYLLWFLILGPSLPWRFPRPRITSIPESERAGADGTSVVEVVDSYFMKLALTEAKKAAKRGEVPIGALVVRPLENHLSDDAEKSRFMVLSAESNRVEEKRDASAHAEMLALRQAARENEEAGWRLLNCTLYTTVEPCAMCLAAAQSFRVKRIVYGAPDLRIGAIDTYQKLLEVPHPIHNVDEVVRGLHEKESAALLREFFRSRRQNNGGSRKPGKSQIRGVLSRLLSPFCKERA